MQPILLVLFLALALAVVIWALYRYPDHRQQWWQRSRERRLQHAPMRRSADRYRRS